MKKRLSVWVISVAALLFPPLLSNAQTYHRLTASDFAGAPAPNDGFAAYTNCYVSYSYNTTRHNGVYNVDFKVQLQLNNNRSWMRFDQIKGQDMLQGILKHEQGHYNIAYLMRNELYSVLSHHSYTSNYQQEIAQLFRQIDLKYHKLNDDYETQTQHMADAHNQQKWNLWFMKQLDGTELAAGNSGSFE